MAILPSEAVLYRKLDRDHPTLLLDEADAIFREKNDRYEGLRAMLNAGYRRGMKVPRCVGESMQIQEFDVFGPKVIAGIGALPLTVADRSIPIRLSRKRRQEPVDSFDYQQAFQDAASLRDGLAKWAAEATGDLRTIRPAIPVELHDRAAEVWRLLLAIADAAGGEMPRRAREGAVALHGDPLLVEETETVRTLRAVCEIFDASGQEQLPTPHIVKNLVERDDGPWAEWWGKMVTSGDMKGPGYRLGKIFRRFGVTPRQLWVDGANVRGYIREEVQRAAAPFLDYSNNARTLEPAPSAAKMESDDARAHRVLALLKSPNPAPDADSSVLASFGPPEGGVQATGSVFPRLLPTPDEPALLAGSVLSELDVTSAPAPGRSQGKEPDRESLGSHLRSYKGTVHYRSYRCPHPSCGWEGMDPGAIHTRSAVVCPRCGTALDELP
jgi:hypothetical protein